MLTIVPPSGSTTFTVAFDPAAYGPKSAFIEFTHNDPQVAPPFRFEVAGFGDAPAIEVREGGLAGPILVHDSPAAGGRDFGTMQLASLPSAPLTMVIVNAGNATLDVPVPVVQGPNAADFLLVAAVFPASITPGGNASFTVQFNAAQVGLKEAQISIASNAPGAGMFVVHLRGVCADPNGVRIDTGTKLPGGRVGSDYRVDLRATGGTAPYSWALRTGSTLPSGLNLSPEGRISGEPTGPAGSYQFEIRVTDINGGTADQVFNLSLQPAPGQGFDGGGGGGGACAPAGGSALWVLPALAAAAYACTKRRRMAMAANDR
jgi:hypothetical protein